VSPESITPAKNIPDARASLRKIAKVLRERDRFLICSHVRPDGDCIGSTLALLLILESMGKRVAAYNPSPIPDNLRFAPSSNRILNHLNNGFEPDVMVFVDCGDPDRVDKDFKAKGFVINIDHHPTNSIFGDLNYVDCEATAVGEQIFHLAEELGVALTPDVASNLLLSIIADTGGFRYPNTTERTFDMARRLVEAGASASKVAQEVFETRSPASLWLEGQVFGNLHFECGNTLVWSEITWDMYKQAGGEDNEPDGLVSTIRGIRGVEVSLLVHEIEEGGLRVGIRSKGKVDVSALAIQLGGGGHHNASGAYILGNYEEIKARVVEAARQHVARSLGLVENAG